MFTAQETFGRPRMSITDSEVTTVNPAPAGSEISVACRLQPVGAPIRSGSPATAYRVVATPQSLAFRLRPTAAAGEKLQRLLGLARTVRPPAIGSQSDWGAFGGEDSGTLNKVSQVEAVGTDDSVYTCGSLLSVEACGSMAAASVNPGRRCLCRFAAADAEAFQGA
jgi:hypothetical protein